MTKTRSLSAIAAMVAGMLGAALLVHLPAAAARPAGASPRAAHQVTGFRGHAGRVDRLADPVAVLGRGWRRSTDRAVAIAGDGTGLHVLVADASAGYAWRTAATLSVRGVETTRWIGQACVTGSGRYAVVVYAPRQITNMNAAQGFAALAAVVNLASGRVVPLRVGVSIAYFDPGCGTGDDAVLTQGQGAEAAAATRLMTVNAATGRITSQVAVAGQVTSAVPYRGQVAAVLGGNVVSIGPLGQVHDLARISGQAFDLVPDAAGGLGYLVASGGLVHVHRYAAGRDRLLGTARLGSLELSHSGGKVWVTGPRATGLSQLAVGWRALDVAPHAQVSTTGALAVTGIATPLDSRSRSPLATAPDAAQPVTLNARATATRKAVTFTVPAAGPGSGLASATGLGSAGPGTAAGRAQARRRAAAASSDPSTVTYDPDRTCSVPRNDPQTETYQPAPDQEEWAVDKGVLGNLTAQSTFPLPGLTGGGRVPAQVMLGVLAQESAEYQASSHVIDGQSGNPEVGLGWYGDTNPQVPFYVNWAGADCGYGTAQVTTGMCMAGNPNCGSNNSPFPSAAQVSVATDYRANIAAGLMILEQKWNEVYSHGIKANGANPQLLENWWFALWDYNSGYHAPGTGTPASAYGLGWTNNPMNNSYPPDREMFLSGNYNYDVANPQQWSYEEKVIGFAAYGLYRYDFVSQTSGLAYHLGAWPNQPPAGEPPHSLFCNSTDNCDPSQSQACQLSSFDCWWHNPVTWGANCANCGQEVLYYASGAANPGNPALPPGYAPVCTNSPLPASAVIVGDTASSLPAPQGCGTSWSTNGGTMTWKFGSTSTSPPTYPSKIDFHQISAGYGGHFWFTHTIPSNSNNPVSIAPQQPQLEITGTWTPPSTVTGWTRIMVSIPNYGAWDPEANYHIKLGGTAGTQHRVVNQAYQANSWVSLGFFNLSSGASVSLTNVTWQGLGFDIAWGAVAFIPASAPTADYVAVGDSYSSAEGLVPFTSGSDYAYSGMQDTCHRSASQAYPDLVTLPGAARPIAQQATSPSGAYQFAYLACSGVLTPDITETAVDTSGSPYYSWDQAGYTFWTAKYEGSGGPTISNTITGYSAISTSIELPEADQGWLSPTTTLVTITQGGDDARFSHVMSSCMETDTNGGDCSATNYYLTQVENGKTVTDPQPLYQFEPQVISAIQPHLLDSYEAIASAAPNAEIIVLGYPRLFPGNQSPSAPCAVNATTTVPIPDIQMLNTFGNNLNTTISNAVAQAQAAGINIHYINPNPGYSGHQICGSAPWINGIVNEETSNAGTSVPGLNSFHLMAAGQQEYATLVNECLAGTLPAAYGTC